MEKKEIVNFHRRVAVHFAFDSFYVDSKMECDFLAFFRIVNVSPPQHFGHFNRRVAELGSEEGNEIKAKKKRASYDCQ